MLLLLDFLGLIVSFIIEKENIIYESSDIISLAKTFSIEKILKLISGIEDSFFIISQATLEKSKKLVTFILNG